eukprot:3249894-Alexandrium_andersonii.AAC.1
MMYALGLWASSNGYCGFGCALPAKPEICVQGACMSGAKLAGGECGVHVPGPCRPRWPRQHE